MRRNSDVGLTARKGLTGMARRIKGAAAQCAVALFVLGTGVTAQEQPLRSQVLVIDFEEVFQASALGQEIQQEIEDRSRELAQEIAAIDAEMAAEEKALTVKRETLPPEDFRKLADAFDVKVQRLRDEQDEKALSLNRYQADARLRFRQAAIPIVGRMMLESGAVLVIEKRNVLVFNEVIDISQITAETLDTITAAPEVPAVPDGVAVPETVPPSEDENAPEGAAAE
ncbi:OmpH family outer membrane protein [Marinovum sp. KMM 9989]